MQHREITAAVVAEIDQLLADDLPIAIIAKHTDVSQYVVERIARNPNRPRPRARLEETQRRPYRHRINAVDFATVRMIERMLSVGILRQKEIAREAGVSHNFVNEIARGVRAVYDSSRPPLAPGERFLRIPIRCSVCRRMISIVPCRACRAVRESKRPSSAR